MDEAAVNICKDTIAAFRQQTEAAKKRMQELMVGDKRYLCVNVDKGMALANRGKDQIGLWPIDGGLLHVRLMTQAEAERVNSRWNANLTEAQFTAGCGTVVMYYMYALEALVERNEQMVVWLEAKLAGTEE
jgi:hypothetical protein